MLTHTLPLFLWKKKWKERRAGRLDRSNRILFGNDDDDADEETTSKIKALYHVDMHNISYITGIDESHLAVWRRGKKDARAISAADVHSFLVGMFVPRLG